MKEQSHKHTTLIKQSQKISKGLFETDTSTNSLVKKNKMTAMAKYGGIK